LILGEPDGGPNHKVDWIGVVDLDIAQLTPQLSNSLGQFADVVFHMLL
jgi:hypothetical protein